nr:MAG TPA: hypothetical protein [Caudoviricetes sp.]
MLGYHAVLTGGTFAGPRRERGISHEQRENRKEKKPWN